jgi:hypothetical protein
MTRSCVATLVLAVALVVPGTVSAQSAGPAAVTAADATPFLGNWNITLESPMGAMAMAATVKVDAGKVAAEISSEQMGKSPVAELTKQGASLVLHYSFDYQGQQIPAALTLAPTGDKVNVSLDIAGGAFVASGTATKASPKP